MKKFIIKCKARESFFVAIHSFTPFYNRDISNAKKFDSEVNAAVYALNELFTTKEAFEIVPVESDEK